MGLITSIVASLLYGEFNSMYSNYNMRYKEISFDREYNCIKDRFSLAIKLDIVLVLSVLFSYSIYWLFSKIGPITDKILGMLTITGSIIAILVCIFINYACLRGVDDMLERENEVYRELGLCAKYTNKEKRRMYSSIILVLRMVCTIICIFIALSVLLIDYINTNYDDLKVVFNKMSNVYKYALYILVLITLISFLYHVLRRVSSIGKYKEEKSDVYRLDNMICTKLQLTISSDDGETREEEICWDDIVMIGKDETAKISTVIVLDKDGNKKFITELSKISNKKVIKTEW